MAALPLFKYSIGALFLYPWYSSRQDYLNATGIEAPPFDPSKPPKYWFDPEAPKSIKKFVGYERVLAVDEKGHALAGPDGKPYLEPLLLARADAATVNIPRGVTNEPGADQPPVPCPLRALEPEEELYFLLGEAWVHNKNIPDTTVVGFSVQDRALLAAIAQKLGV